MILRQTGAIFLDAYRELNSKKLFWVVLFISLAVVVAIGLPGNNERGVTLLGLTVDVPFLSTKVVSPAGFYKFLFSNIGVNLWLTWGATILALISTASLIPDLVTSGSIELPLSRPIGRLRLFLTKYASGLLFVAVQVAIFAAGAFVVILARAGTAEPSVFIAIPLVVAVFSFLFCVSAFVGLITRSALTAILATMIFWMFVFALHTTEHVLLTQRVDLEREVSQHRSRMDQIEVTTKVFREQLRALKPEDASPKPEATETPPDSSDEEPPQVSRDRRTRRSINEAFKEVLSLAQPKDAADLEARIQRQEAVRADIAAQHDAAKELLDKLRPWHRGAFIAKTVLPKTSETTGLLDRWAIDKSDIEGMLKMLDQAGESSNLAVRQELEGRSVWWVIGTSLAFETVVLGIAGWVFSRRDF